VTITIEDDGDEMIEVNSTNVIEVLCNLTGLTSDEMIIEFELDQSGRIVRIIIYVDNEVSARKIEVAVNGMEKGASCGGGVLCRSKRAIVNLPTSTIISCSNELNAQKHIMITSAMLFLFLMTALHL